MPVNDTGHIATASTEGWYDVKKLAKAIARHETGMGTTGVGKTHNNVCGIRRNGDWMRYATIEEALKDCESVVEKYRGATIEQMSKKYTLTDQKAWRDNVSEFYAQLTK